MNDDSGDNNKNHTISHLSKAPKNSQSNSIASTDEIIWLLTWAQAFPTLLSILPFLKLDNKEKRRQHELNTTPDTIPSCFIMIAYHSIFVDSPSSNYHHTAACAPSSHHYLTRSSRNGDFIKTTAAQQQNFKNKTTSLGYGEICPRTIVDIISEIKAWSYRYTRSSSPLFAGCRGGRVVDLGSGRGLSLFAAALSHRFEEIIGIEICPKWHGDALDNLNRWKLHCHDDNNLTSCASLQSSDHCDVTNDVFYIDTFSNTKFSFQCANLASRGEIISQSDLVICHCTVFDDDLMTTVQSLCEQCREGTFFVMVSKCLEEKGGDQGCHLLFETCSVQQRNMDWGQATVYIQRKV